jgi:hypothetical protein
MGPGSGILHFVQNDSLTERLALADFGATTLPVFRLSLPSIRRNSQSASLVYGVRARGFWVVAASASPPS